MRPLRPRPRLLSLAAVLVGVGVVLTAPRWAAATVARLRFPGPIAAADSFITAAAAGDTARLRALATDSVPIQRLLHLRQLAPTVLAAAERERRLVDAGPISGRTEIAVTFGVPTRSGPAYCY